MGAEALQDITSKTSLFYHITMHDFESNRKKEHKHTSALRKLVPTEIKKVHLHKHKKQIIEQFNLNKIQEEVCNQNISIDTYPDLFEFISQIDIGKCFTPVINLNEYMSCRIFEGNYAWISRNQDGHYRYFSKRRKGKTVSLDLLDFVETCYGKSTYESIEIILQTFNIKFTEEYWKQEQQKKYFKNEQFLHHSLSLYPQLETLISENAELLELMNVLGNLYLFKREYTYKNENLFFSSTSYLSRLLNTPNKTKVNQLVNLLATLGLIEKVPTHKIPPVLLKESSKIQNDRLLGNSINYYIVHSFEEVVHQAEQRAKVLLDNGIRYFSISKSVIENLFGLDFAQMIYPQIVQKNKLRTNDKKENIEKMLRKNFERLLNEQGYLTKTMVASLPVFDLSIEKKQAYLKKMWGYLLQQYDCDYSKPTKVMKERNDLPSYEYIASKKEEDKKECK